MLLNVTSTGDGLLRIVNIDDFDFLFVILWVYLDVTWLLSGTCLKIRSHASSLLHCQVIK